jgi:septal ring factor EnvC (AmiA/AmiB activator)
MEDYIKDTLITSPYPFWLTVLIFALVTGLVQCIVFYFKEKGKNLATKEDIGDITKEIKSIETAFINETEKLKSGLSILANVQTDIESIKRNAIIDFNKTVFTFMHSIIIEKISNITNEKALDEYVQRLNNLSEQSFADQILLDLFIEDNSLRKEANEVLINVLEMNNIRQNDILELKKLNDEVNEISQKDIDTTTKRNMLSKMTEIRKKHLEKMYDKQMEKYSNIKEQNWAFQDICRTYIYKLLDKPN